jgi:signal transduction histidine kinase
MVQIEKQAVSQLFQNLLSNSIKYRSPDLPPRIDVQARPADGMWLFSVVDNGIGIEAEWHERIFQPMQRRHGLNVAGSGIGLATCKKIVTRAGGRIWVESSPGEGATFFFTLPGPFS